MNKSVSSRCLRQIGICLLGIVCSSSAFAGESSADVGPKPGTVWSFGTRDARYRVRPGDVLRVSYRYTPEYNATVTVQPDGYAMLPLLGELRFGGQTVDQIQSELSAKASERLNHVELFVDLEKFEQPYIIVGGEVGSPGRFEMHGPITALRAIQIAGGIKASGKASNVLLIRSDASSGQRQIQVINLKRVIDKKDLAEDIDLRAGDFLFVTKTAIGKIDPYRQLINAGIFYNPF
jgi:polysaccharide biosynthesis/export protein